MTHSAFPLPYQVKTWAACGKWLQPKEDTKEHLLCHVHDGEEDSEQYNHFHSIPMLLPEH